MVCHMQIIMVCSCSVLERLEEKGNPFLWPAQQLMQNIFVDRYWYRYLSVIIGTGTVNHTYFWNT